MTNWFEDTALHNVENVVEKASESRETAKETAIEPKKALKLYKSGEKRHPGRLRKGESIAGAHRFTKESAHLAVARKRELAEASAAEGMRRAAEKNFAKLRNGETPHVSDYGAWELANEKMADVFFGSTSLKSMSDALSVLGRTTGMLVDRKESDNSGAGKGIISMDGATLILQVYRNFEEQKVKEKEEDAVDAEFH